MEIISQLVKYADLFVPPLLKYRMLYRRQTNLNFDFDFESETLMTIFRRHRNVRQKTM